MIESRKSKGWIPLEAKAMSVAHQTLGLQPKSVTQIKRYKPFPQVNLHECIPENILKYRFNEREVAERVGSLKEIIKENI